MNPFAYAVFAAILYLRDRPLCAHPYDLLAECQHWVSVMRPLTPEQAQYCGHCAAREVARPIKTLVVTLTVLK